MISLKLLVRNDFTINLILPKLIFTYEFD